MCVCCLFVFYKEATCILRNQLLNFIHFEIIVNISSFENYYHCYYYYHFTKHSFLSKGIGFINFAKLPPAL